MSDDKDSEPIVFRYSRDRRLARASQAVKELNSSVHAKRPGLIKTLTATRGSAFLFLAILMLSATAVMTGLLIPGSERTEIAGNRLELSAFRFKGSTYLVVKKTSIDKDAYRGPVEFIAAGGTSEAERSVNTVEFTAAKNEEFRDSVPVEAEEIIVAATIAGERKVMKARAK